MSIEGDRRAPGATRVPFEGLVEIGTSLGPAFEGQVVDVSHDGMQVSTTYLPDVGQPVTCRFEAGRNGSVAATGEVMWRDDTEGGGSFGLRFTDLDAQSQETLQKLVETGGAARGSSGRVRLHIEGLGVAMKARVRDASRTKLTVGNELGFLQLGKSLELEDAESGEKRPAHIDRVELELDPATNVPRLVVGLRYDDEAPSEAMSAAVVDSTPEPAVMDQDEPFEDAGEGVAAADDASVDEESAKMKSSFARNAAKVTPAILAFAKRAKITAAMLWAKRRGASLESAPARRMTAPPPGGALHASGRKVVRDAEPSGLPMKLKLDGRRKIALGAALGLASVIAFAALRHKPAQPPEVAHPAETVAAAQPTMDPMMANIPPPPIMTAPPPPVFMDVTPTVAPKPGHVTPFGNGAVTHGNVLHLKMDGAIEKINGASQPTGFSVSIPGRKALEPAGPLAARDARIASIKVANDGAGADLDVAFKDGVPNYVVRAKGDTLEIVLAPPGTLAQAKANPPKPTSPTATATAKKKPTPAPTPAPRKK